MPLSKVVIGMPNYVLRDQKGRISSIVVTLESGRICAAIYGFSDKSHYDMFATQSDLAFVPYPLVYSFLQSQVSAAGDSLQLIIVDALGPQEPCLQAITMQAALEHDQSEANPITASYQLKFDKQAQAYGVEEIL